jgi:glycosyltransferase 2 family protein
LGRLTRIMVLASFANSTSVAQLGDVYRGYLLEQEVDVSLPTTLGTIVAERVVDLVTLVALLAGAALTVYSGRLPQQGSNALLARLAVALAGIVGLLALPRLRPLVERLVPSAGMESTRASSTARPARCDGCRSCSAIRRWPG